MRSPEAKLMRFGGVGTLEPGSLGIGRIVRITGEGRVLVDFPGNPLGPVEARTIVGTGVAGVGPGGAGSAAVLLVFENGDPSLPIVVGVVRNTLVPAAPIPETILPLERPKDGLLDGRRIVLDAKEEIELRCGKSSILLRKDGKIVVKGAEITSRPPGRTRSGVRP